MIAHSINYLLGRGSRTRTYDHGVKVRCLTDLAIPLCSGVKDGIRTHGLWSHNPAL